ncbi:MAG: hypothetical protein ACLPXT_08165 [Terracidiphilus sp.]
MKTKGLSERDREILSIVRKEMDQPRLSTSVREDRETEAAQAAKVRAAYAAKA